MTISEAVVKRLYELCAQRNITINKVSIISGVTQSTVSDIVNGKTTTRAWRRSKSCATGWRSASASFSILTSSTIWSRKSNSSCVKWQEVIA